MAGKLFLGTSGFVYKEWKDRFYPKDLPQNRWFEYYVKQFDTVELNFPFYRLPTSENFASWRQKAGENFTFAIKGNRYITHVKRLADCQEPTLRFLEVAKNINGAEDIILWQLPPSFQVDLLRLSEFLKILPKDFRYAFEFRHQTWFTPDTFKLLRENNVAIVFQDFPRWPKTQEVTAEFIYIRFHGSQALYSSSYSEGELEAWAEEIRVYLNQGKDVYAYFNNDVEGFAIANAKRLKEILAK